MKIFLRILKNAFLSLILRMRVHTEKKEKKNMSLFCGQIISHKIPQLQKSYNKILQDDFYKFSFPLIFFK